MDDNEPTKLTDDSHSLPNLPLKKTLWHPIFNWWLCAAVLNGPPFVWLAFQLPFLVAFPGSHQGQDLSFQDPLIHKSTQWLSAVLVELVKPSLYEYQPTQSPHKHRKIGICLRFSKPQQQLLISHIGLTKEKRTTSNNYQISTKSPKRQTTKTSPFSYPKNHPTTSPPVRPVSLEVKQAQLLAARLQPLWMPRDSINDHLGVACDSNKSNKHQWSSPNSSYNLQKWPSN